MREPRDYEAPLCAEVGGDYWFPESTGTNLESLLAKRICDLCRHKSECAEWGIRNESHGIWGGLGPSQRDDIRRKRNIKLPRERSA